MRRVAVFAALAALAAAPAAAHHGWGSYDAQNPLTLRGAIERVQASGPHAAIWLKSSGKTWEIVLAPPSRMANRGLPSSSLRVGETVEVYGYPNRSHDDEMRAEWIKTAAIPQPVQLR